MPTRPSLKRVRYGTLRILAGLVIGWAAIAGARESAENPRLVFGWLEDIVIAPSGFKVRAKLDTGAKTSSIHADELEKFERDGEPWVRFVTRDRRRNNGDRITIERPLERTAKVKRHGRSPKERPVIELEFCLNHRLYKTEFTLTDRAGFNYPVLLGRRMLEEEILVDSALTFTQKTGRKSCIDQAKASSSGAGRK